MSGAEDFGCLWLVRYLKFVTTPPVESTLWVYKLWGWSDLFQSLLTVSFALTASAFSLQAGKPLLLRKDSSHRSRRPLLIDNRHGFLSSFLCLSFLTINFNVLQLIYSCLTPFSCSISPASQL